MGYGKRAPRVEASEAVRSAAARLEVDPESGANGLARLALGLVQLIHDLLERQAVRRVEGGSLTDEEVERLGMALMRQAETLETLRDAFGLSEKDLDLGLDLSGLRDAAGFEEATAGAR